MSLFPNQQIEKTRLTTFSSDLEYTESVERWSSLWLRNRPKLSHPERMVAKGKVVGMGWGGTATVSRYKL